MISCGLGAIYFTVKSPFHISSTQIPAVFRTAPNNNLPVKLSPNNNADTLTIKKAPNQQIYHLTKLSTVNYYPYIQARGTHYFGKPNFNLASTEVFIPLWQKPTELIFTNIWLQSLKNLNYEGNISIGYRHIAEEHQTLLGIYGAFDYKKLETGKYFNHLIIGLEYWKNSWFLGGDFYQAIGKNKSLIRHSTNLNEYLIALSGLDARIGKELSKNLTLFAGGYYFRNQEIRSIYGPKLSLIYDWPIDVFFDKIILDTSLQYDKVRGIYCSLGVAARIGLSPKQYPLTGVSRHMLDSVLKEQNLITTLKQETEPIVKKDKKIEQPVLPKPPKPPSIDQEITEPSATIPPAIQPTEEEGKTNEALPQEEMPIIQPEITEQLDARPLGNTEQKTSESSPITPQPNPDQEIEEDLPILPEYEPPTAFDLLIRQIDDEVERYWRQLESEEHTKENSFSEDEMELIKIREEMLEKMI